MTLILRSNDNVLFTLYTTDYLYSHSILFNSFVDINNDIIDIPFKCDIYSVIRVCNIDINNLFKINIEMFIDMYKFLTFILFNPDKVFTLNFINYLKKNKINYLEGDLLYNEIQKILHK